MTEYENDIRSEAVQNFIKTQGLELKKFHALGGPIHESVAFNAELHKDGKLIGSVSDDGNGGGAYIWPDCKDVLEAVEAALKEAAIVWFMHHGPKFADDGMRLTDCCGACSSFYECDNPGHIDTLLCKKCGRHVNTGEGDGNEYRGEGGVSESDPCYWDLESLVTEMAMNILEEKEWQAKTRTKIFVRTTDCGPDQFYVYKRQFKVSDKDKNSQFELSLIRIIVERFGIDNIVEVRGLRSIDNWKEAVTVVA
jgi:hypothetical protein